MTELNYTEAFQELQQIVEEIETGEISIDALSDKVKRASILIKLCKTKLHTTQEDIATILSELDAPNETGEK